MKKIILYSIAMLISHVMAVNAIAQCPFSYTVYIIDGDHFYNSEVPFSSMFNGYPTTPRVLAIEPLREASPYNPNISYEKDNHWDFTCYWESYATTSCHYFMISESREACYRDKDQQATIFRVVIGTEKSTPTYYQDGTPNLKESRSGRNCILTLIAGPNQNLTLFPEYPSGVNCTHNIQLDVSRGKEWDPLNLYTKDYHGSGDTIEWSPYSQHNGPIIGLGDIKHTVNTDYYYPTFSTPKN